MSRYWQYFDNNWEFFYAKQNKWKQLKNHVSIKYQRYQDSTRSTQEILTEVFKKNSL